MNIICYDFEIQKLIKDGHCQMRRAMKVQPPGEDYILSRLVEGDRKNEGKLHWVKLIDNKLAIQHSCNEYFTCPFGAVGEEIWCKETWCKALQTDYHLTRDSGHDFMPHKILSDKSWSIYKLDWEFEWDQERPKPNWKSPVTMPHEASRLTIVSERIWTEPLQKITEGGMIAEGAKQFYRVTMGKLSVVFDFECLWDKYAKLGYKFADNPMVWCAEVRVSK